MESLASTTKNLNGRPRSSAGALKTARRKRRSGAVETVKVFEAVLSAGLESGTALLTVAVTVNVRSWFGAGMSMKRPRDSPEGIGPMSSQLLHPTAIGELTSSFTPVAESGPSLCTLKKRPGNLKPARITVTELSAVIFRSAEAKREGSDRSSAATMASGFMVG